MEFETFITQLEGELAARQRGEHAELVAELTEAEISQITLKDRLNASVGQGLTVVSVAGVSISGVVLSVGDGWMVLDTPMGQEVVNIELCCMVFPLPGTIGAAGSAVQRRLSLAQIARGLARERRRVSITVGSQNQVGYLGAVRADHVDLTGVANPMGMVSIPFAHIYSIRALS